MSPPKGWKKNKTKSEKEEIRITVKKKPKDDLGPTTKPVSEDKKHAKIIVSYIDYRGRQATVSYTMAELNISENISYEFRDAKRIARICLNIDGVVLEKN